MAQSTKNVPQEISSSDDRCGSRNQAPIRRPSLSNWVSSWNRSHVEKHLHIFYDQSPIGLPSQVLEQIPKMNQLTVEQKKYIAILSGIKFGPNLMTIGNPGQEWEYYYLETMELLKKVELEAESLFSDQRLSSKKRTRMHLRMMDFIATLKEFVTNKFEKTKECIKEGNYSNIKTPGVCEEAYSNIVSAFATLCGLRVVIGHEGNQSAWLDLRGTAKVISKPDYRFYATGPDFTEFKSNLLTVTEVKSKDMYMCTDEQKSEIEEQSGRPAKRRRTTYSSSSSSTSLSQSFSTSASTENLHLEFDVGKHTLGQHAGELLLDLHKYVDSQAELPSTAILTMPGMIVDQTRVYLTLLEISLQHYRKLTGVKEILTKDDKATIHYSVPLDILKEDSRDILFHVFVSLNNIETLFE